MYFSFLVYTGVELIGFTGRKKESESFDRVYFTDLLKRRGYSASVCITEDEAEFLEELRTAKRTSIASSCEAEVTEREEIDALLRSMMA